MFKTINVQSIIPNKNFKPVSAFQIQYQKECKSRTAISNCQ